MTEHTTYIDSGDEDIISIYAETDTDFIALTSGHTVITNRHKLKISINFEFPTIRRLDEDSFLVADARTTSSANAYVFSFDGQLLFSFLAGDGIQDIIIHRNKILITYFDEGVFSSHGPNNDGLAVFDYKGKQVFGFNSAAVWGDIADCYCICKHGTNRVLFYAYTEWKLAELNLDTLKVELFDVPATLRGSSALSSFQDNIAFHSPYDEKGSFFLWNRQKNTVQKVGKYNSALNGLPNSRFLSIGERGFTIVDITSQL